MSPGAWLLLLAIRVYQGLLSPLLPSACRFYPSCSRYACEAIETWGTRRGAWLGARRLLRCRPFVPGGYDPVPQLGPAKAGPYMGGYDPVPRPEEPPR